MATHLQVVGLVWSGTLGLFLLPQEASKLRKPTTSLWNFNARRRILTSWVIQSEHDLSPSQSFVLFVLFTLLQMRLPQNVQYFHFLISYVCPFHQWITAPAIRLSAGKMQRSLYCFKTSTQSGRDADLNKLNYFRNGGGARFRCTGARRAANI